MRFESAIHVTRTVLAFVVAITASATAHGAPPRSRPFVATAYCRGRETATGANTNGSVAAADPRVLPLGTRIRVLDRNGRRIGVYRVLDTGRRIRGRRVDLFFSSCAAAKRFGRRPVRIAVAPTAAAGQGIKP